MDEKLKRSPCHYWWFRGAKISGRFSRVDCRWKTCLTTSFSSSSFQLGWGWGGVGAEKLRCPPPPTIPSALWSFVCEKSQFLENLLEWLFYQHAGPFPKSRSGPFAWSEVCRVGGQENKTRRGKMARKGRKRKRMKRQLLGRVCGAFQPLTSD